MIESSENKKKLFYLIVLVLTFITMIIGATLAYFMLKASQKEEGTVLYTGTLQINYINGIYLENPELLPLKNVTYNSYKDVYRNNFAISSSGTLDQIIAVDLDISKNEFAANAIKYALYNSKGKELTRGTVQNKGAKNLINNIFLGHGETAIYTLIIWLDNTNYNQNFEMGHIITGKINVHAIQARYK